MKKNSKSPKTQEQFTGEVKIKFPKFNIDSPLFDYDYNEVDCSLTTLKVINHDLPNYPLYKLITVDSDSCLDITESNDLAFLINVYKITSDFIGIYVMRNETSLYHTLKIF